MKILIVDCTVEPDSWGSPELQRYARAVKGATVTVRRAPDGDLPSDPRAFDRIIVSGSKTSATEEAPWIDELSTFLRRSIDASQPLLGVCFGHQMLARVLGGIKVVGRAKLGEIGWTRIELGAESPLFKGLPRNFHSFSSHFDEVVELPKGLRNLASSPACAVQAVQLGDRPIFGVQFHPERDVPGAEKSFAWARTTFRTERFDPRTLLHPSAGGKLYDAQVAEKIFGNFLSPEGTVNR